MDERARRRRMTIGPIAVRCRERLETLPAPLEHAGGLARPGSPSGPGAWRSKPLLRLLGHFSDPSLGDEEIHRMRGVPARIRPRHRPRALKVVTWNIERGVHFDGVLRALRSLDADLYLLQEVDVCCRRSGSRDVARDLADALGTNWVHAGEFQEIGEAPNGVPALTGQAVLSRYPIEAASVIRFAAQARFRWSCSPLEPRRGGRIALKVRAAGILFYNAHIESGGTDRLRRQQLEEVLADTCVARDQTPIVIAGDFNNMPVARSTMFEGLAALAFRDALPQHVSCRTSVRRDQHLDWIFFRNLHTGGGGIYDTGHASDHYPLLAHLEPARAEMSTFTITSAQPTTVRTQAR